MTKKRSTPIVICSAIFLLDRLISPISWILFPFKLVTRLFEILLQMIWLLSNEYTKRSLGSCGTGVRIYGRFQVSSPKNLHVGDNVHINSNAFIRAEGGLTIGDNTHISRNVVIYTMNHNYEGTKLPYDEVKVLKSVEISRNVWIGMNVTIIPGVKIGEGAIIGMGTTVSKDIPPLAIIGNIPTRIIKKRNQEHYLMLEDSKAYGGVSGYDR
ncbi:MAG: acyltransferase [Anaerolineales bacterium]